MPARFKYHFYPHISEDCIQAIENSLNILATKKIKSFSFSLRVNIFVSLLYSSPYTTKL